MRIKVGIKVGLALGLLLVLVGCHPAWQATVLTPDGNPYTVDRKALDRLEVYAEEGDEQQAIPLERVLLDAGHRVVEQLTVVETDGTRHEFDWPAVADGGARWLKDGRLSIALDGQASIEGDALSVSSLEVEAPALLSQVQACITDIAPTASAALGLPAPAQATGETLEMPSVSHVLLIFLDGFGYVRYTEALDEGLIPNISALGEPLVGLTTYPPATSVATASLLTGAPPEVHGADRRGIRKTEVETLFDVASAAGLEVVAVEGEALAFNLRGAEFKLSGDRDGNGSTDDNVLANALAALEGDMPDVFYVHFHGIDDAGHTYGPGTPQEQAKIAEVDAAVGQLIQAVPPDTLIILFADHGMHAVNESGRLGNHGHLVARDMFIPIILSVKSMSLS
jgi:hypothetical protein